MAGYSVFVAEYPDILLSEYPDILLTEYPDILMSLLLFYINYAKIAKDIVLWYGYGMTDVPLWLLMIYVAVGEVIGCYVLGELFITVLKKYQKAVFQKK